MLIGADEEFSPVRDRADFFFLYSERRRRNLDHGREPRGRRVPLEPGPTQPLRKELQNHLRQRLDLRKLSASLDRQPRLRWRSFGDGLASGKFFNALKK